MRRCYFGLRVRRSRTRRSKGWKWRAKPSTPPYSKVLSLVSQACTRKEGRVFSRILPVIRKEFIHIIRDPRTLAVMFIAPLMQLILFGYAATSDVRNVPMAVLDQDRTPQSRHLITAFIESGQFTIARVVGSEQ